MRRKLVFLAATLAAVVGLLASPATAASYVSSHDGLTDLSSAANATDRADARLYAIPTSDGSTRFYLILTGLDTAADGTTYGAHIHVGPCVPLAGAAAGPHYNTGGPPDTDHEVWLDFTVRAGGFAVARTTVAFQIEEGDAQALVIHALPTEPGTGLAGGRIACLPVEF